MVTGIRPPSDSGDVAPATRHPRLVHDEMEAIFGSPSSLNTVRRGYAAGVNTHVVPEPETGFRLRSARLWIGLVALFAILSIGAFFLARAMSDRASPHPTQFAAAEKSPPLSRVHLPQAPVASETVTPASTGCSGHIGADGDCLTPPPAIAAPPRRTAAADVGPAIPPAGPAPTTNSGSAAAKPSACEGTGYEHMASCPPQSVLKADSALSTAYASAISADVDPGRLAYYSQRWSQLREAASASPEPTADEFANMTSQLNALTVARASRKK